MTVVYEWDVETVSDDGYEDVLDHCHWDTALEALQYIERADERNMRLVLVRDVWCEFDGLVDRAWSYVEGNKLPERFADSCGEEKWRVPKRFHAQLRNAIRNTQDSAVKRLQQENDKLRQDLEHLRRKVAHGCTDFGCGECDGK